MVIKIADALFGVIKEQVKEKGLEQFWDTVNQKKLENAVKKYIEEWLERNQSNEEKYEAITAFVSSDKRSCLKEFFRRTANPAVGNSEQEEIQGFLKAYPHVFQGGIKVSSRQQEEILQELYDIYWLVFQMFYDKELRMLRTYGVKTWNEIVDSSVKKIEGIFYKQEIENEIRESNERIMDFIAAVHNQEEEMQSVIKEEILKERTGRMPRELEKEWEMFRDSRPWACDVREKIKDLDCWLKYRKDRWNQAKEWMEELKNLDFRKSCQKCEEAVLEKIQKAEAPGFLSENLDRQETEGFRGRVRKLKRTVQGPYQKCFLLTGARGDGKTHFMYHLLGKSTKELCFYIDVRFLGQDKIEHYILEEMNKRLSFPKKNLKEVNFLMEKADKKLILCLDHLDYLFLGTYGEKQFMKLKQLIRYTEYHNIYWVLSIRERCLDLARLDSREWGKYAYVPKSRYAVGNWLSLHEVNQECCTAGQMLEDYFIQQRMDVKESLNEMRENGFQAEKYSPEQIWCMIQVKGKEIVRIANYVHLDVIRQMYRQLEKELDSANRDTNEILLPVADSAISGIGRYFYKKPLQSYSGQELLDQGMKDSLLAQKEKMNFLYILLQNYLLKEVRSQQGEKEYLPDTELIWSYKIADIVKEESVFGDVMHDIRRFEGSSMYDQIFELYLLLTQETPAADASEIFTDAMLREKMFWFAAVEFHKRWKRELCSFISRDQKITYYVNRKNLFGYLYFTKYADPSCVNPKFKLCMLQPLYYKTAEQGLEEYLMSVVRKVLEEIHTEKQFFNCLPYFAHCECTGVCDRLAMAAADRMYEVFDEDALHMLSKLSSYCYENRDRISSSRKGKPDEEKRYFFQRFFGYVCRYFLEKNEMSFRSLFDTLEQYRWYNKKEKSVVSFWLQQAANLEMGNYYRNSRSRWEEKDDYLRLLGYLMQKGTFEKTAAFYLLKHSVPHYENHIRRLPLELCEVLRKLAGMKELQGELQKYDNKKFLQENQIFI